MTGAVSMMLLHQRMTNAYRGVRNVVLAVTPRALPPGAKALLLNAHFDNTLGSPGVTNRGQALACKIPTCEGAAAAFAQYQEHSFAWDYTICG